jgi:hypothetical protein
MRTFTLLPGEMKRIDPPEGVEPLEITELEAQIIQEKAAAHELEQQKLEMLFAMQALCPYAIPSDTKH